MESAGEGKKSQKKSCLKFFVRFDFHGKYFNFYMPDGRLTYKTGNGGILCLLLVFVWLAYALNQAIILSERSDYTVQEKTYENELAPDRFQAGKASRFAVAAALTNLDGRMIGPEIGEIQFYIKEYDVIDGTTKLRFKKLAKRACTLEDVNGETSYGFIPGADDQT